MKLGFYPKLALMGISKNRRLCFPYILTAVGIVMMYYILASLSRCELLYGVKSGGNLMMILSLGKFVIAAFALIFLFYTNSFLVRRRNKEFGLYSILGMDKSNIARIITFESLFISGIGLVGGLSLGILFSKLAELGLLRMIKSSVDYNMRLPVLAVSDTIVTFAVIFFLIYLNSLRIVHVSRPLELLKSENVGEKPPKANWLLAFAGVLLVGGAYVIAVRIKSPAEAVTLFFIAVIMVIIGTYCLMTAGSVTLCRILQKNKKYYYKKNHFVPVASMTYRMKRNGAGLASICILCTMVLVMISSSLSLYVGMEDTIKTRYPRDIYLSMRVREIGGLSDENISETRGKVENIVSSHGGAMKNVMGYRYFSTTGVCYDGRINTQPTDDEWRLSGTGKAEFVCVDILPIEDYRILSGDGRELSDGEIFVGGSIDYSENTLVFNGHTEVVAGRTKEFEDNGFASVMTTETIYIVTPDFEKLSESVIAKNEYLIPDLYWYLGFDLDGGDPAEIAMEMSAITGTYGMLRVETRAENEAFFYDTYGGLFFIGIILSLTFMAGAVLIIYYKQMSEGYEDQSRFEIMQKLGMTAADIRKSIDSQMLMVFFAPMVLAGLHIGFAFPFIWRMLKLFALDNMRLVLVVTVIVYLVYAAVYAVVYKVTSNGYCKIVSRGRD